MRLQLAPRDPRPLAPAATPQHRRPSTAASRSISSSSGSGLLIAARPCAPPSAAWRPPAPGCGPPRCAAARAAHRPRIAIELVLTPVGLLRFAQDLPDQLAVGAVLIHRRVRLDLRPIDRDHPDRHQPASRHSPSTSSNSSAISALVPAAELRDRRVIRRPHPGDHLERDVLPTRPLDPTRRPVPARIRVQKTPPTSPGHTEHDPQRPADTPPRNGRGPSDQRRPAPSTPGDPRAATRSTTAASTTTDHGQRNEISSHPGSVLSGRVADGLGGRGSTASAVAEQQHRPVALAVRGLELVQLDVFLKAVEADDPDVRLTVVEAREAGPPSAPGGSRRGRT